MKYKKKETKNLERFTDWSLFIWIIEKKNLNKKEKHTDTQKHILIYKY